MKLIDALKLVNDRAKDLGEGHRFVLACGFTPLHLKTFFAAQLVRRTEAGAVLVDVGLFAFSALAIHEAARALEPTQREAFQLVVVEGFTHKEAAQLLEIPLGTLKWRVTEAVRRVRLDLEEPK